MGVRELAAVPPVAPSLPTPQFQAKADTWPSRFQLVAQSTNNEVFRVLSLLVDAVDDLQTAAGDTGVPAHAPTHRPITGSDPLPYGVPVAVGPVANAAGTADTFALSDHRHAIDTAADYVWTGTHTFVGGITVTLTFGQPVNVDLEPNSEGTSSSASRADHKHYLDENIAPVWTNVHRFEPLLATQTPVTIQAIDGHTSDVFVIEDYLGVDWVTVDAIGRTGLHDDPDAVLTVRTFGTLTPPGSPLAWYKADDLSLSSGQELTTWADASGNGNTLTAFKTDSVGGAGTSKPKWFPAGHAKAVTNLPAVSFESTSVPDNIGYLSVPSQLSFTASAGWTIAFILRDWSAIGTKWLLGVNAVDLNDNFVHQLVPGSLTMQFATEEGTSPKVFNTSIAHTDGNDVELIVLRCRSSAGGNNLECWLDGGLLTNIGDTRASDVFFRHLGLMISGSSYLSARGASVSEVIFYDTALTDAEVTLLNDYLDDRNSGLGGSAHDLQYWKNAAGTVMGAVDVNGQLGLNPSGAIPVRRFHVQDTATPQVRFAYDASNYLEFSIASNGAVTMDATGAGAAFTVQDPTTINAPVTITSTTTPQFVRKYDATYFVNHSVTSDGRFVWSFANGDPTFSVAGTSAVIQHTLTNAMTGNNLAYELYNSNADRVLMRISRDGRFAFGYGQSLVPQTGTVLGFIQATSSDPSGQRKHTGIMSYVKHDAAESPGSCGSAFAGARIAQDVTTWPEAAIIGTRSFAAIAGNSGTFPSGTIVAGYVAFPIYGDPGVSDLISMRLDVGFGKMGSTSPGGTNLAHATAYWAGTAGWSSAFNVPANRPAISSSFRAPIQQYSGSTSAGSPSGANWAIYGEWVTSEITSGSPTALSQTVVYPATTGFMRIVYPRNTGGTGVRATQLFFEPWPNTSTIRGGGGAGDVYFDDGTNFTAGLWQYAGGGWRQLIDNSRNWTITGNWTFSGTVSDITSDGGSTAWTLTSGRFDAFTLPDGFEFKIAGTIPTNMTAHSRWTLATGARLLTLGYNNIAIRTQLDMSSFGGEIVLDTTNGLKIATATNQPLGFFNATPIAQPSAYTQTYATTSKTHANPTAVTLTDSTGGTANATVVAIAGTGDDANINNNFADLIAQINALVADLANTKQVLNAAIDDLQALGLVG